MTYINMKQNGVVETVDEFPTRREALEMLVEYRMAFNCEVYTSARCTKDWSESQ